MSTIYKTNLYDIFYYRSDNRPISDSHVKRLMDSLCQKNLLSVNPILVDDKMYVLDGQHRLEACKALSLPIGI